MCGGEPCSMRAYTSTRVWAVCAFGWALACERAPSDGGTRALRRHTRCADTSVEAARRTAATCACKATTVELRSATVVIFSGGRKAKGLEITGVADGGQLSDTQQQRARPKLVWVQRPNWENGMHALGMQGPDDPAGRPTNRKETHIQRPLWDRSLRRRTRRDASNRTTHPIKPWARLALAFGFWGRGLWLCGAAPKPKPPKCHLGCYCYFRFRHFLTRVCHTSPGTHAQAHTARTTAARPEKSPTAAESARRTHCAYICCLPPMARGRNAVVANTERDLSMVRSSSVIYRRASLLADEKGFSQLSVSSSRMGSCVAVKPNWESKLPCI